MREHRDREMAEDKSDLGDIVLSWSVQDIMDDDLYRGQVEEIPVSFNSIDHYLKSFVGPLIEETRSDLCSCLELITEAPTSKVLSMEVAGKSGLYFMDVEFWDNGAGFSAESYTARNGDIFILSSTEPEAVEDFSHYGLTYCLALVEDVCAACVEKDEDCLASLEQLPSVNLNQSQVDAIQSIIAAVQCGHLNLTKLIWGPPGTGKTKTVSAILWALARVKCRTLTCAPTNVVVVGVCTRFLQNLKDFNKQIDKNGLPHSLGDILLLGNKYKMDITEELQEVFLDYRADELVECFSSLSGWRFVIASMISFFEDCGSRYDMLLEDDGSCDSLCFLDFLRKQFDVAAKAVTKCMISLWTHLPGNCFSCDVVSNITMLLGLLEKIGALLCDGDLSDDGVKRAFGFLRSDKSVYAEQIPFIEKELDAARSLCLKLLKDLQSSFNLPIGKDRNWVQNYCMRNATLIFCTASSSYRLHNAEIAPLDVLIVDEAAQSPLIERKCYSKELVENDPCGKQVILFVLFFHAAWKKTGQQISIGVISPYSSQVSTIKDKLGKKYDTCDGFHVRVKSVDGFQGEEDDIIILSTVRSNGRGVVGFLADNQRTNVAITRARHCLWILGNADTLYKSGTVWKDLVADAQRRKCIFNGTNDTSICKLILHVKHELDELDDLLTSDSAVFSNTRWKSLFFVCIITQQIILSDNFRKSFTKLKSPHLRREVLQKLVKLGGGWRTKLKNFDATDASQLAKAYRIRDLYLVWSTDLEKNERLFQIIRIWDLLSHQHVARTIQHLENLFSMYTDDYLDYCRRVQTEGKLEVPIIWDAEHDIIRYKKDCRVDDQEDHDHVDTSCALENTKVNESFLLMKFYSLSSGLAKHLLTATDGTEIEIPFELTAEEEVIIRFPLTSFILGRLHFFYMFYEEYKPSIERGHSKTRALQAFIESKEVTFEKFAASYWPHFNAELTKKLDASTVYTEIISHIKGGYKANMSCNGKLERLDYVMLSDKRFSSLNSEMREKIYDVFLDYESMKRTAREFDLSDFVNSLHSSLVSEGYNGDLVDFIYIDEVQDLTMSQIALLKYVCRNFKEGFIFAGDTAQTIARGIDFRFEDVRSLFYTSFLSETETCNQGTKYGKQARLTDMFQLTQNFRTHCGVLRMAQSIMSLLYNYFPSCVDKLNPETGLVYGEAPVLLESDNDENAIMTIFGESRNEHSDQLGFGAEQVILVRDDDMKKQIVNLVGKQALVLTIVECKGLEFQDVLLYNFFSSSPLRNKWRVVYDYMESKYIVASSEVISHPGFDRNKHYLLCSELKQLYVAITRTRQRLWICENADDYCRPMFDYWKKLCIVEVRLLDSSLIQAMQTGSSADDWRLRGTKLFNEGQFEMATMCFEKAGDAYREKWARAAGLLAAADRVISANLEMGQANLQKASEIYESIGMHDKAATCYMKLGDYKRAGMVYMEKCGTSRLEDAGDCFAMSEYWFQAAEVYFKAGCYTKCLSCCSNGKLFSQGLQFLQQLEKEQCVNFNSEASVLGKTFLENCALHYFERGDIKHMMPFVKAFNSMDHVRAFLNSRNLLDELLSIEMEMDNFHEAAGIAKHKGDSLLEVNMLEKAELFEKATQLLLLYVTANSLWGPHNRGWPPKKFAEKEQLLLKVKEMAKKVSEGFFFLVCCEAEVLSDSHKSLASLTYNLLEGKRCGNLLVELISARSIIDVHLQSQNSRYIELEPGYEYEWCCHDMLACNQISLETLACVWNHWRSVIVKVLTHLNHSLDPKSNYSAAMCDDLCAKYFGLRKDDDRRYAVLNTDSIWLTNIGRNSLEQDGNRCWLDAVKCKSCAQNFLVNELSSVGFCVLRKLESFVEAPLEYASSPHTQWRTIAILSEIIRFLRDPEFSLPKFAKKFGNLFILRERLFFELLFLAWGDESTKSFFCILDSSAAHGLIVDSLGPDLRPANRKLTHGYLGKMTMYLLYIAQLDDVVSSKLGEHLYRDSDWARFFQSLKSFLDFGEGRNTLIWNFKLALEYTSSANWRTEPDYISPICYVNLMECLGFLASTCLILDDCAFCTKSLLIKMLKCRTSEGYLGTCLVPGQGNQDLDRDMAVSSRRFIFQSIMDLLRNKRGIQEWARATYIPVLLRLVTLLYLVTMTLPRVKCYDVTNFLRKFNIFEDLPPEFSIKIANFLNLTYPTLSKFRRIFADALAAIGSRMVVLGSPSEEVRRNLNARIITIADLSDVQKVMALLCPEEPMNVVQELPMHETKACNVTTGNFSMTRVRDNNMESRIEMYLTDNNISFWEKFESIQVFMHGQKDVWVVILFLRNVLPWLEQRSLPESMDEQLLQEVRHICDKFEEQSIREKSAHLSVDDLYSIWSDGENKLQKIISFMRWEKTSMEEPERRNEAAPVVLFHTDKDDETNGYSDNEPDIGGRNVLELTKEEATSACCSTSKKAQKQKNKKSRKSKRSGRK
ncbi:hypothetical protein HU200_050759 [Digitaria exilis]|uniref:UvrD-like helicase ATP-binding domain-containing protein n=1 Tax=Digitaria exilis TaxID=1010633 RepID=A0A835E8P0_9POAL|nr:hypothetical protein HU200_050759 [Digitaria exilis]